MVVAWPRHTLTFSLAHPWPPSKQISKLDFVAVGANIFEGDVDTDGDVDGATVVDGTDIDGAPVVEVMGEVLEIPLRQTPQVSLFVCFELYER
jgi:hypothetical protein